MTPVWIAGVLNLVPLLAVLGIIAALYAVYLFYLGLPPVMATPAEKVIPYMVVSALVIIVVSFILASIAARHRRDRDVCDASTWRTLLGPAYSIRNCSASAM